MDKHHITARFTYYKVFGALIILTIVTVLASLPQFDAGHWNTFIAMFIATIKASLVVWWFMHQNHEGHLNRLIFISGFVFLIIFFGLTAADVFTRSDFYDLNYNSQIE